MTIARYGERWIAESRTGVAYRSLNDHPGNVLGDVASSNMKKFCNYTDWHDVDEDLKTITYQSGYCYDGTRAGVMRRSADYDRNSTFVDIASLKNKRLAVR